MMGRAPPLLYTYTHSSPLLSPCELPWAGGDRSKPSKHDEAQTGDVWQCFSTPAKAFALLKHYLPRHWHTSQLFLVVAERSIRMVVNV